MSYWSDRKVLVVGASRGLGRGVTEAFLAAGATVTALSRDTAPLAALADAHGTLSLVDADATDPASLDVLRRNPPDVLALVAGASPELRPLTEQTWETFSTPWNTDVRIAFLWLRQVLRQPLAPGSRVLVTSSGAALKGSVLSGGYAGGKATVRFLADYAAQEAARAGLDITVHTVLPQLTPETRLGRAAVDAYAERAGVPPETFVEPMRPVLTPEAAGAAFLRLGGDPNPPGTVHLLTSAGLTRLP
ncbi:SDR family NAD(P)-dependent oxidoreductase [Micromonospora sp. NBC_00617]|uniref:SDR family NAD(P)-dependent oxidoreductase n=1 Tax=Micromonospora sp. NBC_00617 TaxID=2903587 RepID=UPI0030E11E7E